ncbi:FAD:protein FMN transferase [Streptococcus sp. DD12]|uniref:FAD:protein FMN transferase n=1 Tax=Streptococcus sp. DD12 TaxID=1777880 RepID=UPI0007969FA8|nr:FAD:protein FMN transferase [Streptococcus sp. DD12]KXT76691.1 hypothetical protein STRDD12_00329 [Streptococcus sp. DD12]
MKRQGHQVKLMGTVIDLQIYHEMPEPILAEAERLLRQYEARFSANRDDSELAAINQAAGKRAVWVPKDLYDLIRLGKHHSCAAGSRLNISIGPLVQAWRIGFPDARVPEDERIQTLRLLTNPQNICLDDRRQSVFLTQAGMKLDLGALAKGYIADRIVDFFKSVHVPSGFINLGGNVLVFGPAFHHPDQLWRVGIQRPNHERGQHRRMLALTDASVVTSGVYERRLQVGDKTFHHILDPQTGYPMASEVTSLTIVSPLSVQGEVWTSRLFGYHPDEVVARIEEEANLETFVQTQSGDVAQSSGLANFLLPKSDSEAWKKML